MSKQPASTTERPLQPYATHAEVEDAFARHVSPGKVKTYRSFGIELVMGRREGPYFYDAYDQRRWLNVHCNGGVFNLGHRNPRVLAAVRRALDGIDIGNHHLISGFRARLAERLAATTGGRLSGVVFGVSGGEAIDLAIKMARAMTKRTKIISANGGYHGHTGLALAAGDAQYREMFGPNLPGFQQVPFDDLAAVEAAVDDTTAAVVLEPVPATLGMPIPSDGYLDGVQRLCHDRGALFIVDEVQTGLGRSGKIWCFEHDGSEPDILVTGKGLSGGVYPISATLMTGPIHDILRDDPFVHISTYGGAEPGCAAALEVLDIIEEPGFLERVQELAERFASELSGMPFELRQRGLFMGLKFPVSGGAMAATKLFFDAGIFAVWANHDTSVLQFLPPLTLTDGEFDELVGKLKSVFP